MPQHGVQRAANLGAAARLAQRVGDGRESEAVRRDLLSLVVELPTLHAVGRPEQACGRTQPVGDGSVRGLAGARGDLGVHRAGAVDQ